MIFKVAKVRFFEKEGNPCCLKKLFIVNLLNMKHLYILICLLSFSICSAQDQQLFENTWFLENLIIEGEDNFPPFNSEVSNIPLDITVNQLSTQVCAPLISTDIEFSQVEDTFTVNQFIQFPTDCLEQDNQIFQNLYFITFFEAQLSPRIFDYEIEFVTNDSRQLILTNEEGNQAIYGAEPLSTQDFSKNNFAIFPNPAKENIVLSSSTHSGNLIIQIINIQGKVLSNKNVAFDNDDSINVSNLSKGIYFLNIEDESGNKSIKKFVKN